MQQLPNWVLTNPMPSVYDSESATAIEMVAKLYGAVQGLITECNDFDKEITKFMKDEETRRTDFETKSAKVLRQFICEMNAELEKINNIADEMLQRAEEIIVEKVNEAISSGSLEIIQSYNPETEELRFAVTGEV